MHTIMDYGYGADVVLLVLVYYCLECPVTCIILALLSSNER